MSENYNYQYAEAAQKEREMEANFDYLREKSEFYSSVDTISIEEIKKIDDRILSVSIDNPEFENPEYYVKIWFNYSMNESFGKGRKEFVSLCKVTLINDIKTFLKDKNKGFDVIHSSIS
jgi:hypothetical protein